MKKMSLVMGSILFAAFLAGPITLIAADSTKNPYADEITKCTERGWAGEKVHWDNNTKSCVSD